MERRKFTREFKLEAVRLIKDRGVSYVQASQDLNVHPSQLRDWVKKFSEDAQHAFPGHGQMKPEQLGDFSSLPPTPAANGCSTVISPEILVSDTPKSSRRCKMTGT